MQSSNGFFGQKTTELPSSNVQHSTFVSLQVYSNGSVQISNVTSSDDTPSMMMMYHPQKIEQERMLARERVKQNHLNYIREQLMHILLAGRTPPSSNVTVSSLSGDVVKIKEVVESGPPTPKIPFIGNTPIVNLAGGGSASTEFSTSEVFAQRLQSFYPSCDVTILNVLKSSTGNNLNNNNNNDDDDDDNNNNKNNDNDNENKKMKLYFDLTIPKSPNSRTHITVMWAKLRLFMFNGPKCDEQVRNSVTDNSEYLDMMSLCESNKLIISLYQYVPPLKQNRYASVRLVDQRTLSASYRGRVDFNVQSVINDWQNKMPNYGLLVQVEDRFNTRMSPAQFIHQMNCSDSVLPIPNLAELYGNNVITNETTDMESSKNRRLRYPTLDLMTMESARDDRQKIAVPSSLSSMANTVTADRPFISNFRQIFPPTYIPVL